MLFFNLDCTDFPYNHDTSRDGGEPIDRYVDRILDGGVTHFLCNTQAERVNYASEAWEPFWTGYDPDAPDDQPFLAGVGEPGSAALSRWRRLVDSMLNLHRQGIDYPARVLQRCRERGAAAWITLRMNDVHCQDNEAHPIHSSFWRDNLHLRRQGYAGYHAKALDYAHAEVRNYYRALIVETLQRYDIDGLELDFMREPYLFTRGEEENGREILTEWLREMRELARAAAERRGHAVQLGIRVPSRHEVCVRFGLDPVVWAEEGLIDVLVPTPRWASIEFDVPIAEWRRLLAGSDVVLLGGLEVLYRPFRHAAQHGATPAQARGAAAHILGNGADGVYLFNYFPSGQAAGGNWWPGADYARVLRTMTGLDELQDQPRTHAMTGHDVNAPDGGENSDDPLPATGTGLDLSLATGPRAPSAWQATLVVDLESFAGDAGAPLARVNRSAELRLRRRTRTGTGQTDYPVPRGYLRCDYELPVDVLEDTAPNRIRLWAPGGEPVRVLAVQIELTPPCAADCDGDTATASIGSQG